MSEPGTVWQYVTAGMDSVWTTLRDEVLGDGVRPGAGLDGMLRISHPVEPFNQPSFLAPLIGIAGVVIGMLLAGVALSALGAFAVSILALALLLTKVYGVTVEIGA